MEPENRPLEKGVSFWKSSFSGSMLNFGGVQFFMGCWQYLQWMELDFKTNMFFDCTEEAEPVEDEGRKEVRSPLRVVSDGSLPLRF